MPFGNELAPEDVGFDLNFAGDARIGELSDFTYPFERLEHLEDWEPGSGLRQWRALREYSLEPIEDGIRVSGVTGHYPVIAPGKNLGGLPAGTFAIAIDYRYPTEGRFRFHWVTGERSSDGAIDLFPRRDGATGTIEAVFATTAPLEKLRIAAPTHLYTTGQYDPAEDKDGFDLLGVRLYRIDKATAAAAAPTAAEALDWSTRREWSSDPGFRPQM